MGLANNTSKHKQDNFFLFFPVYVCLGVYYLLEAFATPFIWFWNFSSTTIYKTVNKVSKDSTEFRGADL